MVTALHHGTLLEKIQVLWLLLPALGLASSQELVNFFH